ncbi:MAG: helix-turn-helix transcriptional regulator [Clostridia bacterium]|nr:helix-turn-helix transcriptional regulator [Clostridia bacterium]
MEFHEKLQQLRKQKGLTQESLAAALFVSRTAVSKWESGRGHPGIDSLKALAQFYGVTVDALLSGEELLCAVEEEQKSKEAHLRDTVFGLLDCAVLLFLFLPLFGVTADGVTRAVSLLALTDTAPYLRVIYFALVIGIAIGGILMLALQSCQHPLWVQSKYRLSYLLGAGGVLWFILCRQPYAAAFLFLFVLIKTFLLLKRS